MTAVTPASPAAGNPGRPPRKQYVKNFWKYRFLLRELVNKNIKLQYRNSVLGLFWTFLQPLLTMIVLSLVFGQIFGHDETKILNYPTYLLCGRLIYEFYTQATKKSMRSILGNAAIIKKVYVPKYIYPLSNIISTFVTFLISLTVLAVVMGYFMIFTDENASDPLCVSRYCADFDFADPVHGRRNDSRYDARVLPGCGISL